MLRNTILFTILIYITSSLVELTSARLLLNKQERKLDALISRLKAEDLSQNFKNIDNENFFQYKRIIEKTNLYKLIKEMPKGASLDGHLFGLVSHEYIYTLTHSPDLFINFEEDGSIKFSYENYSYSGMQWHHLPTLRRNKRISEDFLKGQLSLRSFDGSNPSLLQKKVSIVFNTIKSLFSKISVLKDVIYQMLKEHYQDNIMYIEFRYSLDFYDSKINKKYKPEEILKLWYKVIKNFKKTHPNFIDAKMIYSPMKHRNFTANFNTLMYLTKLYPNFLVGCDVYPEITVDILNRTREVPNGVQFFLHFGENIHFAKNTNLNLLMSPINRPSRYIYRNSILTNKNFADHLKDLGVGINICPLSIMKKNPLTLRYEPIVRFINEDYHIVVCNEFSNFWEAHGISYDWYVLFVFMTNRSTDLSFLKQIALNSLTYSGLQELDSMIAITEWTEMWNKYIQKFQNYI